MADDVDIDERYRRVADGFTQRVEQVPEDRWDSPSPCDGWVARDVVGHLVGWMPGFFFGQWGLTPPTVPAVGDDPAAAWLTTDAALRALLDDAELVASERDLPMGRKSFGAAFEMIAVPDVLVHTWDLARATGLDDTLDADEVARQASDLPPPGSPMDEMLRSSGQFGPRVEVPDDAPAQDRLLGFMGRQP